MELLHASLSLSNGGEIPWVRHVVDIRLASSLAHAGEFGSASLAFLFDVVEEFHGLATVCCFRLLRHTVLVQDHHLDQDRE